MSSADLVCNKSLCKPLITFPLPLCAEAADLERRSREAPDEPKKGFEEVEEVGLGERGRGRPDGRRDEEEAAESGGASVADEEGEGERSAEGIWRVSLLACPSFERSARFMATCPGTPSGAWDT